jgi:pimeloyl-ACP methyl ester carboxylesterase
MHLQGRLISAAILCILVVGSPSMAQTPTGLGLTGSWQGNLLTGDKTVRMVLNLKQTGAGELMATLDLPDVGVKDRAVQHLVYGDRIVSFEVNLGAQISYEGAISRDRTEMIGSLTQGPNVVPLNFQYLGAQPDGNANRPAILLNQRRKIELKPCGVTGLTKDALCGQYEGRKLSLNLMVLPALVDRPEPDAIFYLQGGPGGAATSVAGASFMMRLHRTRDVVLVDQRGTGKSNPLFCNLRGNPDDMRGAFVEGYTVETVRACRTELEKNADLRLYTTTIAMADLDDVRAALGYDKINVYGGSYGSTAALSYLNFYPQHVRTVTILGVAPPDNPLPLSFAKGVEHAINRLIDDCAADEKCQGAFPELRKDWMTVVANVSKEPVTFDATNPYSQQKQQVTMTREGFAELVRLVLYNPTIISLLPATIHEMSKGDYSHFAFYAYQVRHGLDVAIARGMQLSVICVEDIPFLKEADIQSETSGTFYGSDKSHAYIRACEQWPRGEMPAKFRQPIKSDLPVLILSGEVDPVTPPYLATPLLRGFPNGRQVIMHNATHSPYECQETLAREFIEKGTAKDLQTSCVEGIKRLPFATTLPPLPATKRFPQILDSRS